MNFHDYHLRSYTVRDYGRTVLLDLIYDYPGSPVLESRIEFTEVIVSHFIHDLPSIITEIHPVPMIPLFAGPDAPFAAWLRETGYIAAHTGKTAESYAQDFSDRGYQAWQITSAMTFSGFIIAKNVHQL